MQVIVGKDSPEARGTSGDQPQLSAYANLESRHCFIRRKLSNDLGR